MQVCGKAAQLAHIVALAQSLQNDYLCPNAITITSLLAATARLGVLDRAHEARRGEMLFRRL